MVSGCSEPAVRDDHHATRRAGQDVDERRLRMPPPGRPQLLAWRSEHDQLRAILPCAAQDLGADSSGADDPRLDLHAVGVAGRARAFQQLPRLVFLGVHMRVERKCRRDVDDDERGQGCVVVGSEPACDLERLERLGARVEKDEYPPVAPSGARAMTPEHTSNGRFEGLKPDSRSQATAVGSTSRYPTPAWFRM